MNIEKLHNKKINIFGDSYTIKIVNKIEYNNIIYSGMIYHNSHIIEIAKYAENTKLSNEEMMRTLLHEINHAIFTSGQYIDTNDNEPLIEWLAKCMYSLIFKQKIFS